MRNSSTSRRRHPIRTRVLLLLGVLFLVLFGRLIWKGIQYSPVVFQYLTHKNITLKKTENRVNILILGIGGGRHEGPNLTDTIIFASIDPQKKTTTLVSIPRDLWVKELNARVNTIYSEGQKKRSGGGLILTKAMIGKLLNQQIDYGFRIDFQGFEKIIDMLGGLDIDVARPFDDYAYPISGKEEDTCGKDEQEVASLSAQIATEAAKDSEVFTCRYEHLHFEKGMQHMDGVTALKYVRSRHALGAEGSDFARSQRQQKIITALRDKVFSVQTLMNPIKIASIVDVLQNSIDTDITQDEYDDFIKLAQQLRQGTIRTVPLDTGDPESERDGLLINPPISEEFYNAWVLIPRLGNGNYSEIQEIIGCKIKDTCPAALTPTEAEEKL